MAKVAGHPTAANGNSNRLAQRHGLGGSVAFGMAQTDQHASNSQASCCSGARPVQYDEWFAAGFAPHLDVMPAALFSNSSSECLAYGFLGSKPRDKKGRRIPHS